MTKARKSEDPMDAWQAVEKNVPVMVPAPAMTLAVELAAKVRGYFTNPVTGKCEIGENLDGDRDLYELASRITKRVIQPGSRR